MREAVVAELTRLRKGEGLTVSKLRTCRTVLGLNCVTDEAKALSAEGPVSEDEHIIAAGRCLRRLLAKGDDLRSMALRNALAIGVQGDPGTLTRRREDFASAMGISSDTVRHYEHDKLQDLSLELVELSLGIETQLAVPAEFTTESPPEQAYLSPTDLEQGDLHVRSVDTVYRFVSGRIPAHVFTVREIEALREGVQEYVYPALYTGGHDSISAEGIDGCTVETQRPGWSMSDYVTIVHVKFDYPLSKGEIYRFSYLRRITSDSDEPRPELCHTLYYPTDAITLMIQFAPGATPAVVWPFESSSIAAPQSAVRRQEIVPVNGHVRAEFRGRHVGRTCGLQWKWEAAEWSQTYRR